MAEDPCLPTSVSAHPNSGLPSYHRAHRIVGRIRHRVHVHAAQSGVHRTQSVACGRPEMARDGGLPAMPAGRLPRAATVSGKMAALAKAAAVLIAVGLAGAGAATLSGLAPPSPVITQPSRSASDPGVTGPVPPGQRGDPGGRPVPVPEPPSILLVIVAGAGVLAAKWLGRGEAS